MKQKDPKVSIVTSTYNDSKYLTFALESILAQTFKDWEVIIINDASTDNTRKIITNFAQKDKRIKSYLNKKNCGLTYNLNKAINLAKGKFIARLDGDDIWVDKTKLQRQVDFLQRNSDYGLVGSWAYIIDIEGNIIKSRPCPINDSGIRSYIAIENCFIHSSVVMRKDILRKVGSYDDTIISTQDYDLWLKIGLVSKMYNFPEHMVHYRINPDGMSIAHYDKQLDDAIKIAKKYKGLYPKSNLGIMLWKLRKYVPTSIRVAISNKTKAYHLNK